MPERAGRDEFSASETRMIRALWTLKTSRAFLVDLAVVLGMTGTHALALAFAPPPSGPWAWPLLVSVPALCLLLVRRQFPWTGLVVLLGATVGLMYLDIDIGPLNLAILVSVYSITSENGLWVTVAAGVVAMAYPVARLPFFEWPFGEGMMMLIGEAVELMIVAGWGWSVRVGRQRAAQLQQTLSLLDEARDQFAADAAAIERARLAREFHDIVSHNLAVVALRAGVARSLVDRDPTHARDTLTDLEQSSRSALGEMRELLGTLRNGTGGEHEETDPIPGAVEEQQRRPAPTLEGLDALVNSVRGSGLAWKVDRRGAVRELGPGVEMTAYRIVQEAVTNVLKHAGFGKARVVLDYGETSLSIEVINKVSTPEIDQPFEQRIPDVPVSVVARAGAASAGHGLIGLRERVAILGGTLTAYPVQNGFHLAAVLPCPAEPDLV